MALPEFFISCDWGTSNFRLSVVRSEDCKVLCKEQNTSGIKSLYQKYQLQKKQSQFDYFSSFLRNQINKLPSEYQDLLTVVGGMASSNLGLKELAYASLPIQTDGKGLVWEEVMLDDTKKVLLVSGIKDECDLMRGEELQCIGIAGYVQNLERALLILPGTHSKHIDYDDGKILKFNTYMTGELFELLRDQSILSNSIANTLWSDEANGPFMDGVRKGQKSLNRHLFNIRASHVLGQSNKTENYFQLSGMLIGNELAYLKDIDYPIVLAAPKSLARLYQVALEEIVPDQKVLVIGAKDYQCSSLIGQRKILSLHYGK